MAYALGFPRDVTDRIYSMRDWRWERVRRNGGTPSRLCFELGLRYPWHEDGTTWLVAIYMPYYSVETDSERPDYGEIVLEYELDPVIIESRTGATSHTFNLRNHGGGIPAKFRELQKQNDRRVKETWFQCDRATP